MDTEPGFAAFSAGRPDSWYGQGIRLHGDTPFPDPPARRRLKARSALGRPPIARASDGTTMWVPRVSLQELLAPYPRVDLVDIDVQGLELSIVESAIEDLDERVRRLHIGTHSQGVERRLRRRSRTARLEIEAVRLQRLIERLREKNATLKAKLAHARRKAPRS